MLMYARVHARTQAHENIGPGSRGKPLSISGRGRVGPSLTAEPNTWAFEPAPVERWVSVKWGLGVSSGE